MQISDTHFGTERPEVMRALLDLARRMRPDLLVLSGDITQRAKPSQFEAAREFMDSLGAPALAIPGNHDIALFNVLARLFWPYANYRKAFGADLERVHSGPDLLVLCVNTTRPYRHKHGEVSAAQIERVALRLKSASVQQLRVVVVHQPIAVQRPEDAVNRVRGHSAALQRWAVAGADIVMGGHIHLPYVCDLSSSVNGLARRLWCVQAGTAVSSRIRREAPNSVNLLEFANDGEVLRCDVERWDYQKAASTFELAHSSGLNLQRQ